MQNYRNKLFIATFIVVSVFLLLTARLAYLQIVMGEDFERFSLENRIRMLKVSAPRGNIYDRNGIELVSNRASFDVNVFPNEVKDIEKLSLKLARILAADPVVINNRINAAKRRNYYTPTTIARDIDRDTLAIIEARKAELRGISVDINYLRNYDENKLGSHIIGYLGRPDENDLRIFSHLRVNQLVGKYGIERAFEEYLYGKPGTRYKVIDALGREVRSPLFKKGLNNREVTHGNDLHLTIDRRLQKKVEELLYGKTGSVVVMNVNTGEILAMASSPSYDPQKFVRGISSEVWERISGDSSFPMINRATQVTYPPASVFKMIPALAALHEGLIDADYKVYCPGHYTVGTRRFRCWKRTGHGNLNLNDAMSQSCDVYFYHIGEKLGIDKIAEYSKLFGFGSETRVEIPERQGRIPTRSWKREQFNEPWYRGETVVSSIGQGYIGVTPLQVAVMTSAIANGGIMLKPTLVRKIVSNEGEIIRYHSPEVTGRLPFSEEHLQTISNSLLHAVNSRRGTGGNARIPDYQVAGKTGTAQVVSLDIKTDKYKHEDHAWFTSFFPYESPEIAVTVIIEHAGRGGSVAAPIARSVIEEYIEFNGTDPLIAK